MKGKVHLASWVGQQRLCVGSAIAAPNDVVSLWTVRVAIK